ncbi:unnamed protein product [Rotaria sp. Silwood2]|nr:unnamed protein product [Rotaria sp. Silwood2]CAF4018203.1 unnamed protein product [Rotaria sp. Silwood2]
MMVRYTHICPYDSSVRCEDLIWQPRIKFEDSCNNIYTRCDDIWNCDNGADEMNFPLSTCPSLKQICLILPPPHKLVNCGSIEKANDTNVNCYNRLDDHQECHKLNYYFISLPLLAINSKHITQTANLCITKPKCINDNNE